MVELHPLLAGRWSPRAFDPADELTTGEVRSLLEAARWAPSAGNSQPWRFVVGHRDGETHKRIFCNLPTADQCWAGRASALLVGLHVVTGPDGNHLPHAAYDLGQAIAHLSVQATAMGRCCRQIMAFDNTGLAADLDLPAGLAPGVVVAVGRLGDPGQLPADLRARETALRRRRPLADLLLA